MKFEWDENKYQENVKKHGVTFEEAKSVFNDKNALFDYDKYHSNENEDRFLIIGTSDIGNILLVCHCIRSEDVVRIISARKATNNEEKLYNKNVVENGEI